jgi:NADP-dependent 3-hydroxy acid dehydrogenase YdfG
VAAPLIVITGATHGIGRALAIAFARDGHPLLLVARHAETIAELADHPHRFAEADVTDYARLQAAIAAAETEFGPTDCLVNNAGFIHIGDFAKRTVEDLDYEIDVLFKGVVHGCRAVLPGMIERRRGTIVNVSSIGDRRPGPSGETYHASKTAVRSLAESLQQAEAKNNIRIINIRLGEDQHPSDHGHFVRGLLQDARQSRLHRARTDRRDHRVLLQAAAVDLHPRPGGDADHVRVLIGTAGFAGPAGPGHRILSALGALIRTSREANSETRDLRSRRPRRGSRRSHRARCRRHRGRGEAGLHGAAHHAGRDR